MKFIILIATVLSFLMVAPASAAPKHVKIRLLAIKHSYEQMAVEDINLLMKEAEKAAGQGLKIKVIGRHSIDKNGERVSFKEKADLPRVQEFLSEKFKIDAEYGDTLILFTVGHGGRGGSLHNLTNRKEVMDAIAGAAAENKQRVLWWQLSCYATAQLPAITDLPKEQQKYLSIVASSNSTTPSPAYVEYQPIGEMLQAMVRMGNNIDPNKNGSVSAGELKDFLNTTSRKRGHLFFSLNMKDPVFGWQSLARLIPIVDRNGPQGRYREDYIGVPD